MDDVLNSPWNEEDLKGITSKKIIALNTNRFQLTKFVSSLQTVIKLLRSSEISPKLVNLDRDETRYFECYFYNLLFSQDLWKDKKDWVDTILH